MDTTEASAGVDPALIDLERLRQRCLGNLDLLDRVLNTFTRQLDVDLAELEQALAAGDAELFAHVAHRVKGMSANVEARDLSDDARLAEQRALESGLAELPECLAMIRRDRDRLADSFGALKLAGR